MTDTALPIYLDYQATTPIDPRVLEAMMPYLTTKFGNPHSSNHRFGWEAAAGVELARAQVAELIGAAPQDIIFTSGATESNNLVIKGMAYAAYPAKDHIITVATEHPCVLESCASLERAGFKVTYLPVNIDGLIDLEQLKQAITEKTSLVSIMAVNNEIGVIQNLKKIGEVCTVHGVNFHTDAAQAVGKIPLNILEINCDFLSISGHKIYGPKGVGALYLRSDTPLRPLALFDGGGQEGGLRPGTLSPALCAGLGAACHIAVLDIKKDYDHIDQLSKKIASAILNQLSGVYFNGSRVLRFPGNLNITFEGAPAEALLKELRDIAFSTGSACATGRTEPSHVLTALGLDKNQIDCTVRIGLGRMTREADIDYATDKIIKAVQKIRRVLS